MNRMWDEFWAKLWNLAAPMIVQNLVATLLSLVDTLMVGQLGDASIAAVGLANQFFFLLTVLVFGITSGAVIFMAQYWGKGDVPAVQRVQGLCLGIGLAFAIAFTAVGSICPRWVLGLFSGDMRVVDGGGAYLRIATAGYIPFVVTQVYAASMRSTEHVKAPMMVSMLALGINTLLNYFFILGRLGFPALGVEGAALATVVARLVECGLLLSIIYGRRTPAASPVRDMWRQDAGFFPRFKKTTLPVLINEGLWALGVTLYSVIYAGISTEAIASVQIACTVERLGMVLAYGAGHACAIIVGNRVGAGETQTAYLYAKRCVWTNFLLGALGGIAILIVRFPVMGLYQVSDQVYQSCMRLFIIMAAALPVRCIVFTILIGILRSGGDTRYSLLLDMGPVWLLGLPGAYIAGILLGQPVYLVYGAVTVLEETIRLLLGIKRFRSRKWIHNLVEKEPDTPVAV